MAPGSHPCCLAPKGPSAGNSYDAQRFGSPQGKAYGDALALFHRMDVRLGRLSGPHLQLLGDQGVYR